jgi:hypothetical protein
MTALHPNDKQKKMEFVSFLLNPFLRVTQYKVCDDQISDAILDAHLARDPFARVACESLVTENKIILAGEISAHRKLNKDEVEEVVRNTICQNRLYPQRQRLCIIPQRI